MSKRPTAETVSLPEFSAAPRLPSERTPDDYEFGERVVVFAPMTNRQRSLKRGTIERISQESKRVCVCLDYPPPKIVYHGAAPKHEQGTYSAAVNQPVLMKESDYDRLYRNPTAAREWVSDGYMDNQRLRDALFGKLVRVGVNEAVDSAAQESQLQ